MKRCIVWVVCVFCLNGFAQEYSFIPSGFEKIEDDEFKKRMVSDTLKIIKIYLENGKSFDKTVQDSLLANKTFGNFSQLYFLKKSKNEVIIIKKLLSEDALKARNLKQKKDFKENKKAFESLDEMMLTELNLIDIHGKKYDLEDLKDKIIVLNFWFTKCKPCVAEIPDLNKIKEKYKSQNVAFFAVTFDSEKILHDFLNKRQFDFTIIPNGFKTIQQFKIQSYPTTIIIDKQRKINIVEELLVINITNKIDKMIGKFLKN
jgi:thiol-disulfide isomerase/thioredoxin